MLSGMLFGFCLVEALTNWNNFAAPNKRTHARCPLRRIYRDPMCFSYVDINPDANSLRTLCLQDIKLDSF